MKRFEWSSARALWLCGLLVVLAVVAAACGTAEDPEPVSDAGEAAASAVPAPTAMVWSIAGLRLPETTDADVVAMYGPGALYGYADQPPDARYYTDPAHEVTLMVGTHTDDVVVLVKLTEGTVLPAGVDPAQTVTTLSSPVAIDQGIALGLAPDDVLALLGTPALDQMSGLTRTFIYSVGADDPAEAGYVNYSAVYEFENERLRSIEISAGE